MFHNETLPSCCVPIHQGNKDYILSFLFNKPGFLQWDLGHPISSYDISGVWANFMSPAPLLTKLSLGGWGGAIPEGEAIWLLHSPLQII